MIGGKIRTVVLLGLLSAMAIWIGSLWGGTGMTIAFVLVLVMNVSSYWFSDKIALSIYRAHPADRKKHARLIDIVQKTRKQFDLPMPHVYIIPSESPNAFATGRNPAHAAIACTEGILGLLDDRELRGVIAHEMAHIRNRDTLIQTIAATIAGLISYAAMMARWAAIFGGFGGRDQDGGNVLELLALAVVTPLIATIIQLAISRSREYMADESAARTLHDGHALASALEKLESSTQHRPMRMGTSATAHLFITNPFKKMSSLLSTHPSTTERVRRLRSLQV
ncbi:MAG: zinc metalloprotease HtpX [Nanoarchaeota archaeon]